MCRIWHVPDSSKRVYAFDGNFNLYIECASWIVSCPIRASGHSKDKMFGTGTAASSTTNTSAQKGVMPIKGGKFRNNDYPNYSGSGSRHTGTDLGSQDGAKRGDPVVAAFTGTLKPSDWGNGYGNHVVISSIINGVEYRFGYAHLDSIEKGLSWDTNGIQAGQVIGYVGSTGNCKPVGYAHLHLEVRIEPF